jgi:three-Cys-motif partner protein
VQAVFKHRLLRRYVGQFGAMTGYRDGRLVYLDGYAGKGRYENGDPGSAELVLRLASYFQNHRNDRWTVFLTERDPKSYARLKQVAQPYIDRGLDARVLHLSVEHVLDQVIEAAADVPLFLFLDPCGLGLTFDQLTDLLTRRPNRKPPTEVLLNFSMDAVRRLGAVAASGEDEQATARMDGAVGGEWWQHCYAELGPDQGPPQIAAEFAKRLSRTARMRVESVPVRRKPHHKPVYNLVFGTRSPYGTWVFGDALARTLPEWWDALDQQEAEADPHAFITKAGAARPDLDLVRAEALKAIQDNIVRLLRAGYRVPVIDHAKAVFGDFYGLVDDSVVKQAVRALVEAGQAQAELGRLKPRQLVVYPPRPAATDPTSDQPAPARPPSAYARPTA